VSFSWNCPTSIIQAFSAPLKAPLFPNFGNLPWRFATVRETRLRSESPLWRIGEKAAGREDMLRIESRFDSLH
jgi:hypothetical protein